MVQQLDIIHAIGEKQGLDGCHAAHQCSYHVDLLGIMATSQSPVTAAIDMLQEYLGVADSTPPVAHGY